MDTATGTISTRDGEVLAESVALTFFGGRSGAFNAPPDAGFVTDRRYVLRVADGRKARIRITGEVATGPRVVVYGFALLGPLA